MLLGEHSFLPIEYLSLVLCVLQLLIANIVYLKQEFQDCPIIVWIVVLFIAWVSEILGTTFLGYHGLNTLVFTSGSVSSMIVDSFCFYASFIK